MRRLPEKAFRWMSGRNLLPVVLCLISMCFPLDLRCADESIETQAKEEDMLQGVLYDLKLTSDGMPTHLMKLQGGKQFNRLRTSQSTWNLPGAENEFNMIPLLKQFVLSNWQYRIDYWGNLSFRDLSGYARPSARPYKSYIYQPPLPSSTAPQTFFQAENVSDAGWVGLFSGYVVAPFTGKFRFVGYGNDALAVHFDQRLVLDYGCYALSVGSHLGDSWDYKAILGGTAARTDGQNRMVLGNPIYSQCKLETYFPSLFDNHGVAKGVPLKVEKGSVYPVDILVTDIEDNTFCAALFIERLDSDDKPLKANPAKLPLFRTASDLPEHSSGSFPDFDDNSPVWKVVDSRGRPIPSHIPAAEPEKDSTPAASEPEHIAANGTKDPDSEKSASMREDLRTQSSPERDPDLSKKVTTITRGNVTTETVTEFKGDATVETVTTTETNGDTTLQTVVVTETKNGAIVRKTTFTSKTVVVELFPEADDAEAKENGPLKPEQDTVSTSEIPPPSSAGSEVSDPSSENRQDSPPENRKKHNPFGYKQPPTEDE